MVELYATGNGSWHEVDEKMVENRIIQTQRGQYETDSEPNYPKNTTVQTKHETFDVKYTNYIKNISQIVF